MWQALVTLSYVVIAIGVLMGLVTVAVVWYAHQKLMAEVTEARKLADHLMAHPDPALKLLGIQILDDKIQELGLRHNPAYEQSIEAVKTTLRSRIKQKEIN